MNALHIAARNNQVLTLYKLIAEKCQDVNVVDLWGLTPLDHAVACGHYDCCLLLICQGGAAPTCIVAVHATASTLLGP
jgi:ankyrin repeat protein